MLQIKRWKSKYFTNQVPGNVASQSAEAKDTNDNHFESRILAEIWKTIDIF